MVNCKAGAVRLEARSRLARLMTVRPARLSADMAK
jgi:hypothetical protein